MRLRNRKPAEKHVPLAVVQGGGRKIATFEKKRSLSRTSYFVVLGIAALVGARAALGYAFVASAPGIVDVGTVQVGAEVAGRIVELHVEEGATVEAGHVLGVVEAPGLADQVALSRATAARFATQVAAERERAAARGRRDATTLRARAAELRDRALEAEAEIAELQATTAGLRAQVLELDETLAAYDELEGQAVRGRHSYVDLRVQRLELNARREAAQARTAVLERRVEEMRREGAALEAAAKAAADDALAASQVAFLEAQHVEALAEVELRAREGRSELVAPAAGTVTWVQRRAGEVVLAGQPVFELVPSRPATVVVYPGGDVADFEDGVEVRIQAPGVDARGTVVAAGAAHRERPLRLLKPYERARVGPLVRVRVDRVDAGALRAGAEVAVSRAAVSAFHWLGF